MSEEMYCPDCGRKMEETKAKWYCPGCGFRVPKPAPDLSRNFDWDAFRAEAAKDILCAIIQSDLGATELKPKEFAYHALNVTMGLTDDLIAKLKEK